MSNNKALLLKLVEETPVWSPAADGDAEPVIAVPATDPPAKRGRPRKVQPETVEGDDTGTPPLVAVRGEGRGGKRLLKILKGMAEEVTLYYDNYTESYISLADGVIEHLCVNKSLQERFALLYFKETGETLGADGFASAVLVLAAQAKQTGQHIELFTRAGWHDGRIYYDLKNRRSLCVTAEGWSLQPGPSLIFHRIRLHVLLPVVPLLNLRQSLQRGVILCLLPIRYSGDPLRPLTHGNGIKSMSIPLKPFLQKDAYQKPGNTLKKPLKLCRAHP